MNNLKNKEKVMCSVHNLELVEVECSVCSGDGEVACYDCEGAGDCLNFHCRDGYTTCHSCNNGFFLDCEDCYLEAEGGGLTND